MIPTLSTIPTHHSNPIPDFAPIPNPASVRVMISAQKGHRKICIYKQASI